MNGNFSNNKYDKTDLNLRERRVIIKRTLKGGSGWRMEKTEELHNWYVSPNTFKVIK
jgi:hypothetical protein